MITEILEMLIKCVTMPLLLLIMISETF